MEKQSGAAPPAYDGGSSAPPYAPPPGPPPQQGGYQQGAPPPQGQPPQQAGYQQGAPPPQGHPQQAYPPQAYPPQQYHGQPQQVVTGAVIVQPGIHMLGTFPANMQCPNCRAQIQTKVDYEVGLFAWLIVGVLFLVGLWLCCFIPLCVNDCKDVVHSCPNCNHMIGRKNRLS